MTGEGFQALASPIRRQILKLLSEDDLTAGQIAESFDISKPSISNHLNILKDANLITSERHGRQIIYHLNMTVFQELMQWFEDLLDKNE